MRPLGPGSPMRRDGSPRVSLAGGQSLRSGTWPSRVWITVIPIPRAVASTFCNGGTTEASSETSLPSVSPKPPGSTKSRCMSNANGYGSAATLVRGAGCSATGGPPGAGAVMLVGVM